MTARRLVQALDGDWHGSYGTARCPSHRLPAELDVFVVEGGAP